MNKLPNHCTGLSRYNQKAFRFAELLQGFDQRRKGKQTNDADVLDGIVMGFASGQNSMTGLADQMKKSRSVLENFLNLKNVPSRLRKFIKAMIKRMKRGKMIKLENVKGKYLAAVDGVETMRHNYCPAKFYELIRKGRIDVHCQVAVHRDAKTGQIKSFDVYHRLVVICLITDRGPIPVQWHYQQSEAGATYKSWLEGGARAEAHPADGLSEEKAKQEGELTVTKQLLSEIHEMFGGRMPFDILVGDGLYDKATIEEQAQMHGIALVAVHKDERRNLRKDAEQDFSTRLPDNTWEELDRFFEGWSGIYIDQHLDGKDKTIKIVRVKRRNKDGAIIDNYFYCSNIPWITPRLVEWCRHYRWREENGFNAWTNLWGILKHIFHHTATACDAMIALFFITVIAVQNYRLGNLRRAGRQITQTLQEFFSSVLTGYTNLGDQAQNYWRELVLTE